jgi:transposase
VQQAYEEQLGHPVHHSLVYRALHRPGWRKIMPRPTHPKTDVTVQEELKKAPGAGPGTSKAEGRRSSGAADV